MRDERYVLVEFTKSAGGCSSSFETYATGTAAPAPLAPLLGSVLTGGVLEIRNSRS